MTYKKPPNSLGFISHIAEGDRPIRLTPTELFGTFPADHSYSGLFHILFSPLSQPFLLGECPGRREICIISRTHPPPFILNYMIMLYINI